MTVTVDVDRDSSGPFGSVSARRAYLAGLDRLAGLGTVERDLVRLGQMPGLARWVEQVTATGGCARPVYLSGSTVAVDSATGEVLRSYSTCGEPGERLAVRCRNRRASRCQPCSYQYAGDTFQLVRAGLAGGKGIGAGVAAHPRVFVTLTAPSFGRVHREGSCHAAGRGVCGHGVPVGCGRVHEAADPLVGQPVCAGCYDYPGHVLWHAHAGVLWTRFTDVLYHRLARAGGVGRSAVRRVVRVSAVKVAEYQRRGAVHFHAVIRLDGPDGPAEAPPGWASAGVLVEAVRSAAGAVSVPVPESAAYGARALKFGDQLDVRALASALTDGQMAGYLAKYVGKSVSVSVGDAEAGTLDRRLVAASQVRALRASNHVRALVGTCWRLGGLVELQHLRLRAWAHALGYRGHCVTKTRAYSTTYGRLRAERAQHTGARSVAEAGDSVVVERRWRYVHCGHSPAEALVAAGIAADLATERELARELRPGWVGGARRDPGRGNGSWTRRRLRDVDLEAGGGDLATGLAGGVRRGPSRAEGQRSPGDGHAGDRHGG